MSKPNNRAIAIANLQNEFEFEGKTYIAINVNVGLEEEEQCRQQCAFYSRCKQCKPHEIPPCLGKIRVDGLDVCFVEKGNRFLPKPNQKYWIASTDGKAIDFDWCYDFLDKKHLEAYNTFPTRKRAQEVCDKIKALLESEAGK